ncbi:MAG: glycosyltransferase family 4 protein [Spirochaetota bacterium]
MNICILAYTIYETDSRVRRYAETLAARDHRVDVISLRNRGDGGRSMRVGGVNVFRVQSRGYREGGPAGYLARHLLFLARGGARILLRHLRRRYAVIHVNNIPDFLVFAALIPRALGCRVILDIHDLVPELFCEKFGRSMDSLPARLLLLAEKVCTRFADRVIVANDLWRRTVITRDRLAPGACITLLNYPDLSYYRPAGRPVSGAGGEVTLVYPGTFSHLHGVDVAVRAMALVRQELPRARLMLYGRFGSRAYYEYIRALMEELELDGAVAVRDPVPPERLMDIYARADIGLVPKRRGIFSDRAFSTKIFDYLAVGIPVIASRTTVDEYYFDDTQIMFFNAGDHRDLARKIVDLCANPEKGRLLARNARRFLLDNNWEARQKDYLDLVQGLSDRTKNR